MNASIKQKIKIYLLYSSIFSVMFFAFLFVTFPEEAAKERIIIEIEQATNGRAMLDGVSLTPFGLTLKGVSLVLESSDASGATRITADRIELRPSLLALVKGKAGASFSAQMLNGALSGYFSGNREEFECNLDFETLDLTAVSALTKFKDLKLKGNASGSLVLAMPEKYKDRKGNLSMDLQGLVISLGNIMGFETPELNLGNVKLEAQLNATKAEIKELTTDSEDLSVKMGGDVILNYKKIKMSNYDTHFVIDVKQAFWDKNPKLVLVKDLPMLKPYLRSDNKTYGVRLTGRLNGSPRPQSWKK